VSLLTSVCFEDPEDPHAPFSRTENPGAGPGPYSTPCTDLLVSALPSFCVTLGLIRDLPWICETSGDFEFHGLNCGRYVAS